MVLKTPREQIQVNFSAWADKLSHAVATTGREARKSRSVLLSRSPTYLSSHNSKLDPAPVTLLCINPVWGLGKEKHMILNTQKSQVPAILLYDVTLASNISLECLSGSRQMY